MKWFGSVGGIEMKGRWRGIKAMRNIYSLSLLWCSQVFQGVFFSFYFYSVFFFKNDSNVQYIRKEGSD